MGLAAIWLDAAQLLGFDLFMDLWRLLSADEAVRTADNTQILLTLRDFRWYERHQRDLYIRRLAEQHLPLADIHSSVRKHLGDQSSYTAIKAAVATQRGLVGAASPGLSAFTIERMRRAAHSPECPDMFPVALEHALIAQACKTPPPPAGDGPDPRLAELRLIGLPHLWLRVAALIGYDAFVTLWRRWSANPALRSYRNLIELRMPLIRVFERYQRNRYIETLVAAGLKPSQIYTMLRTELGENMSFRHLNRLAAACRVGK